MSDFDVIVIGAGHAGIEAAAAAARLDQKVLVVTLKIDRTGFMSCNPAIGGLAKGHIVKEIDCLGGEMGFATDQNCIQFKKLNATKGPAVRGSRAQCDKDLYSEYMCEFIKTHKNISILEGEVSQLSLDKTVCNGVVLSDGSCIKAKAVIITTGTFLGAVMHIGNKQTAGGRVGDKSSYGISNQLKEHGFKLTRLKTGTPARLLESSVDWSKLDPQYGDDKFVPFSFRSDLTYKLPQITCYLGETNERTHQIIRENIHLSPMFSGEITGLGPRYCPSIEDKISRFAEKTSHQTFLEKEGLKSNSIYLQGISTSLPEEVQYRFLKTISGLENVKLIRPGYAVEYDFVEPTHIWHSLETREIENLYLAGQINGTSGYEEAAGQGLVAGVNAALKIKNQSEFILKRSESYIGVMIDDLITKGTKEPYRMMTSRAEYRLNLREDNAIERMLDNSVKLGLMPKNRLSIMTSLVDQRNQLLHRLRSTKIVPNQETQEALIKLNTPVLKKPSSLEELLRRSEISCLDLNNFGMSLVDDPNVNEPVEIQIKYSGYIEKQNDLITRAAKLENKIIPKTFDYSQVKGLSIEELEKLNKIKPVTIGQAGRISGVNPSAIQAILIYLKFLTKEDKRGKARPSYKS